MNSKEENNGLSERELIQQDIKLICSYTPKLEEMDNEIAVLSNDIGEKAKVLKENFLDSKDSSLLKNAKNAIENSYFYAKRKIGNIGYIISYIITAIGGLLPIIALIIEGEGIHSFGEFLGELILIGFFGAVGYGVGFLIAWLIKLFSSEKRIVYNYIVEKCKFYDYKFGDDIVNYIKIKLDEEILVLKEKFNINIEYIINEYDDFDNEIEFIYDFTKHISLNEENKKIENICNKEKEICQSIYNSLRIIPSKVVEDILLGNIDLNEIIDILNRYNCDSWNQLYKIFDDKHSI